MNESTITRSVALAAALLAAAALVTHAGPLNPPAGPVASTYKTLTEVEPRIVINSTNTPGDADSVYRITQPGSYYLTADVIGQAGKHGIEVEAANVNIDMCGFALRGAAGSLSGLDLNGTGPNTPTTAPNGSLKNGLVTGWGQNGLTGNNVGAWVIEEVRFHANTGWGATINSGTVFTRCYFTSNSLDGCGTSNHVEFNYCFSSGNGGHGFAAGSDSQFVHCEAGSNAGSGFVVPLGGRVIACTSTLNSVGIIVGDGGSVDNCHVDVNRNEGIIVGKGGTVTRCAVDGNGTATPAAGIYARLYTANTATVATITECTVTESSGDGINLLSGTVTACTAESNGQDGIQMIERGVISQCTAKNNGVDGIVASQAVSIIGCNAGGNLNDGIQVNQDCLVKDNLCENNGAGAADGAGIHTVLGGIIVLSGPDNRIEGNNVLDNDRGIDVDGAGNLIIRNSASGNTDNYGSIVASNSVGTIVNVAGAAVTTSNSFANLEF